MSDQSEAQGSQAHHAYGELRPSAFELPVLRVRFTDPSGSEQHLTCSSTWTELATVLNGISKNNDDSRRVRGLLTEKIGGLLGRLGCNVHGIDFVESEFEAL